LLEIPIECISEIISKTRYEVSAALPHYTSVCYRQG